MPTKPILNLKGFSIIELLVVMGVLLVLVTTITIYTNPSENRQKARDQRRLADIAKLTQAFEEFKADNKVYPDIKDTVRYSNISVAADDDISSASGGWLDENLSGYLEFLPTDPFNTDEYVYTYIRDDLSYELNCKLEYYTDTMTGDNGDDDNLYEVGDDLTLL